MNETNSNDLLCTEQEMTEEEIAEYEAEERAVYCFSCLLMKMNGDDSDPDVMIYSGYPEPEPWGIAYQRYEDDARKIVDMIGVEVAQKIADLGA